jgi:hypothetical protein
MSARGWHDLRITVHRYELHASPAAEAEVPGTRAGYFAAVQVTPADEVNPSILRFNLMWAEPPGHLPDNIAGGLAAPCSGYIPRSAWVATAGVCSGRTRDFAWHRC